MKEHIIDIKSSILDALKKINELSDGVLTLFVIDNRKKMVGSLTDGDIRRSMICGASSDDAVKLAMNSNFAFIKKNELNTVVKIREIKQAGIQLVPILDSNRRIVNIINLRQRKTVLPIDAILMAGGKGVRLRPLTENTPKPLLPVGTKAIIDHNVDRLISYGIQHISVTVNYLHEQIEQHYEKRRNGVKIDCVLEPSYLGTIGAITYVKKFYNDTILIMNSDLFTNIDYEDFYLHFVESNADMSVAAVPYSVSVPYGIFNIEGGNILGVQEKPVFNYFANAGIYLIKRKLINDIPKEIYYDATDLLTNLINKKKKVIRYPITGFWLDIGNIDEYKKAKELVKHVNSI